MNKQRKILIGVLCSGLGALLIDRIVIGPPQTASASAIDVSLDPLASSQASPIEAQMLTVPVETNQADVQTLPNYQRFHVRLKALRDSTTLDRNNEALPSRADDPFALPDAWQPAVAQQPAPEPAPSRAQPDQAFLARHQLDATLTTHGEQRAVIGNRLLKLGDRLDGYRIVQIHPRWVLWESIDGQRPLVMEVKGP